MDELLPELIREILSFTKFNEKLRLKTVCKQWDTMISINKKNFLANIIYETYNSISIGESIVIEFDGTDYPDIFVRPPLLNISFNLRLLNLSRINWLPNRNFTNFVYTVTDIMNMKICELRDVEELHQNQTQPSLTDSKVILISQIRKDKYKYKNLGHRHFYVDISN